MSAPALEAFLARLYTDEALRRRFLADPRAEAGRAGLSGDEMAALERIDRPGLLMAAESFARKRARKRPGPRFRLTKWLRWG
jgi:hypothetical protein